MMHPRIYCCEYSSERVDITQLIRPVDNNNSSLYLTCGLAQWIGPPDEGCCRLADIDWRIRDSLSSKQALKPVANFRHSSSLWDALLPRCRTSRATLQVAAQSPVASSNRFLMSFECESVIAAWAAVRAAWNDRLSDASLGITSLVRPSATVVATDTVWLEHERREYDRAHRLVEVSFWVWCHLYHLLTIIRVVSLGRINLHNSITILIYTLAPAFKHNASGINKPCGCLCVEIPTLVGRPLNSAVTQGSAVTFQCSSNDNSSYIQWYSSMCVTTNRNADNCRKYLIKGGNLGGKVLHRFNATHVTRNLNIRPTQLTDAGVYLCAERQRGVSGVLETSSAQLIVLGNYSLVIRCRVI